MRKVRLPRSLWTTIPIPDWLTAFERELNATQAVSEAWERVTQHICDVGLLVDCLYCDSLPQKPDSSIREMKRALEKAVHLMSAYPHFGGLGLANHMAAHAALLSPTTAHEDNECAIFHDSIYVILVMARLEECRPTYDDCIQVIQAAINATDKDQADVRETKLTPDAIKSYLKRCRRVGEGELYFSLEMAEKLPKHIGRLLKRPSQS